MDVLRCEYCNDGTMIKLANVEYDGRFVKFTISCHGFSSEIECLINEWISSKDQMIHFAASVFYDYFETIMKGGFDEGFLL